jgi:hypothetical protein
MTLKVKLDEQTMRNAEVEADARGNASRMAGIVDQRVGSLQGNVADLIGLLGEIGFAKIFGMQRDDTVYARSGTADFTAHDGTLIEVKSSHRDNPHLLVPAYKINGEWTTKEDIGVYVLMHVAYDDCTITFCGWCSREDLIKADRLEYFRGASRLSFVLPPDELRQLDSITEGFLAWTAKARGDDVIAT